MGRERTLLLLFVLRGSHNPHGARLGVFAYPRQVAAARRGQIRCLAIVVVNPLHESEGMFAGSNDPTHGVTLVGALTRLSKKILETL